MSRRILTFILLVSLGLVLALNLPVRSQSTGDSEALQLALAGQQQYRRGKLTAAVETWQQAAEAYERQQDTVGVTKSLINKSQALQELGLYPQACWNLVEALTGDSSDCSQETLSTLAANYQTQSEPIEINRAIGLRSLGDVLLRMGNLELSEQTMELSWQGTKNTPEAGATLLSLGNVKRAMGERTRDRWEYEEITEIIARQDPELALEPYNEAFTAYERVAATTDNPLTEVQSQLNQLNLVLDTRAWWQQQTKRRISTYSRLDEPKQVARARSFLDKLQASQDRQIANLQTKIAANIDNLTINRKAIFARIGYAQSLLRLEQTEGLEPILDKALAWSRTLQDRKQEAYALGYLGRYYAQKQQTDRAIASTRQALALAQEQNFNGDAREIVYLWQSQLGSLLRQQEPSAALVAYAAAFNTLQTLRTDLNVNDRLVQFDFREEVRPVYLELVDLLLSSALSPRELKALAIFNYEDTARQQVEPKQPLNLELARRVIESLQLAELDNYFQDPCSEVVDVAVRIDDFDPQAAVIYPISLPDRLAVILSLPNRPLQQITIPVSDRQVNATLDELYDNLYNESVNNSAINIVRTVPLNPQELELNNQKLLPIFQQIYSWLIEPIAAKLESEDIETLVFVLNDRLQRVPMAALFDGREYLLEKYNLALAPSLQLIKSQSSDRQDLRVLAAGVSEQVEVKGEIFPPLVNVPLELEQIQEAFPASEQLLDEEFTTTAIENQLQENFSIVHLATHGLFSSNPNRTFIVTGDKNIIGIDRLSALLNVGNPELVVLSACETATGDERAVLGFAGVTVRSGTQSTLATLWSVEDATTARVMGRFYQEFKQPEMKKVEALRKAQLGLLKSLQDSSPIAQTPIHPYYWAPFVLVGNWQ